MAWSFDGYCYGTEAELAAAVGSSPAVLMVGSEIRVQNVFASGVATDGIVTLNYFYFDKATNTWVDSQNGAYYGSVCTDPGPLFPESYALTIDQVPLFSAGLALMFFTAYAGKKLRTLIEGYYRGRG